VRSVLGSIDLDPFSSALANETVKADRFLTVADDALGDAPWCVSPVTAFLNPPYGKGVIDAAVARFLIALPGLSSAIVLVNNATETHWFQKLIQTCNVACFVNHRIAFVSPDNKQESGNTRGQVFMLLQSTYWSTQKKNQKTARERVGKFTEVFSDIGFVMGAAP
jgi:ParB family chromosome partitioning protein